MFGLLVFGNVAAPNWKYFVVKKKEFRRKFYIHKLTNIILVFFCFKINYKKSCEIAFYCIYYFIQSEYQWSWSEDQDHDLKITFWSDLRSLFSIYLDHDLDLILDHFFGDLDRKSRSLFQITFWQVLGVNWTFFSKIVYIFNGIFKLA